MPLTSAPIVIMTVLLLTAPGLIWAWYCYPAPDRATRLSVGLALGLALPIQLAALLAWGPGITPASVLITAIVSIIAASALAWRMRVPHHHLSAPAASRHTLQLGAVLAIIAIPRLLPLVVQSIPQGWDPSFHSLLASTTLTSHRLPTWSPFEQISSNYPYGPHVFMAEISLITGVAPDVVFNVLLNAVLPIITCLVMYPLARRVLRRHSYALGAVAAYGLLGNWGSIDYRTWGGLPNALGCFVLLVFLVVLCAPGYERMRIVVGAVILGTIPLVHHHVMLVALLILTAYTAYLVARWRLGRHDPAWRRQSVRALRRLALTSGIAALIVSYYIVPIALRVGQLGNTTITRYADVKPEFFPADNGVLLWVLALAGAAIMLEGILAYRRSPNKPPAPYAAGGAAGRTRALILWGSVALLLAFFAGYYVYRYYTFHFTAAHQPYTLFTPSRFLNDLTYFLAIPAGVPLVRLWQWSMPRARVFSEAARAMSGIAVRMAMTGVMLTTAILLLDIPNMQSSGQLAAGEREAYAWIRAHTPRNTLVVNLDPNARWAPYFTQREVAYTPVPISEFTTGYVDEKRALATELTGLEQRLPQARVMAFAGAGTALSALAGRPVALLTDKPLPDPTAAPSYSAGPELVYLLGSAFGSFDPSTQGAARVEWWSSGSTAPASNWNTVNGGEAGWVESASPKIQGHGDTHVRINLNSVPPADVMLACDAPAGITLSVDGQPFSTPCTGQLVRVPRFAQPGPHVIGIQVAPGGGDDPWFNVLVVADGAAS